MKSARLAIVLGVIIAELSMPAGAEFIADQSRIRIPTADVVVLDLVDCQIGKGPAPLIW